MDNSTWGYDEYNDSISEELHHSLRAGTRQSNGVVQLFEPMSMREENWAESEVKNALRAGASKSSHAIVELPAAFSAGNSAKAYGIGLTEHRTPPLRAGASGTNQVPTVLYSEQEEHMSNTNNLVVRRLTPNECEALMGWDQGWTAEGLEEDGTVVKMADSHRYKMCGNGVVANVAEWFGVRYEEAKRNADTAD